MQSQRMEALGQLAGGIAHDFNNVLQAVSGGLGLIRRRAEDPASVRKLATMADEAAKRGAAITGRLLAFARRGELQATPIDPADLLLNLREILAPTLGVGIRIEIDTSTDAPLFADRPQLETALVNLAVNARDAMPGGGTLRIALAAEPDAPGLPPGPYIRIELTDTGHGMPPDILARASEPFFTTKPPGQGTGLGLAMARGFALQSDGGFAIASTVDAGTSVTLWFPQASLPALTPAATPDAVHEPTGQRVLLVDDDAMVRTVLAGQLEESGYQVTQASDGLHALARLDGGEQPDLLVTDFAMPGMNGLALIQEARARHPALPVLLLTGFADPALDLAGNHIMLLRKPIPGDELAARARLLLTSAPPSAGASPPAPAPG